MGLRAARVAVFALAAIAVTAASCRRSPVAGRSGDSSTDADLDASDASDAPTVAKTTTADQPPLRHLQSEEDLLPPGWSD